ncbi:MAG: serine/threonine-protein kinase [Xenococcaceae cyanobacterium MO_167.B27]|nr:serine/threonine-protein kinase [Xenococcaceae cyanobacterium MO_167.B27]
MDNFPDLKSYGYQVLEPLGHNTQGGRITWKAKNLNSNQVVVVKQFCFATPNSTWSGYKAYQQEIAILQNLKHPGIPQYIDSFETPDGFCLIQEYIKGQNLNQKNYFTLKQIKLITKNILEILVYLQQQKPPILHQDIKPENILIDEFDKVYLIDFGLANRFNVIDENTISSIPGTPGFIAPEQAIAPTKSSDLYSLGVTIICLLTRKKSSEIIELITPDQPYKIQFQSLISDADTAFINWLEKMVQPQVSKRFVDAISALEALQEIDWELRENRIATRETSKSGNVSLSPQLYGFSTLGMGILGIGIATGIHVTSRVTDKTFINVTIAIMGLVVIYIAQYAAATVLKTDPEAKTEAMTLAIATPITLTIAAGFIMGKGEAVAMSFSATIAQTATLISILWQKLALDKDNNELKFIGLLLAIAVGMILGLTITI